MSSFEKVHPEMGYIAQKWSFPLRISSVNNGFDHYCNNNNNNPNHNHHDSVLIF